MSFFEISMGRITFLLGDCPIPYSKKCRKGCSVMTVVLLEQCKLNLLRLEYAQMLAFKLHRLYLT